MTKTTVDDLLGLKSKSPIPWHKRVVDGLPFSALTAFEKNSGMSPKLVRKYVGVYTHKFVSLNGGGSPPKLKPVLSQSRSDRLFGIARLTVLATELFEGDRAAAVNWLITPAEAFSGETPLSRSRTAAGARDVEDLIGRLEHGVFS